MLFKTCSILWYVYWKSIFVTNFPLLQTYGLQLKDSSAVEMCTFVLKVQEDSAAESAGLTAGRTPTSSKHAFTSFPCIHRVSMSTPTHTDAQMLSKAMSSSCKWLVPFFCMFIVGDIIVTINGVSIEGSSHQHILDLIKESTNSLK